MSDPSDLAQTYLEQATRLLDLPYTPQAEDGVVRAFRVNQGLAQTLLDFELPDALEPAPIFRP